MKLFEVPMVVTSLVGACLLAGPGAPPARADFTFGQPVDLRSTFPFLNTAPGHIDCFSADGLEMYIASTRGGGQGGWDLWVLKRDSVDADWGPLENLGPSVNSPAMDIGPFISADGLILYFCSNRSGGYGDEDLYMATRATRNAAWGQAVNLGPKMNTPQGDGHPCVAPNNLEFYFDSNRPGGYGNGDIYVCRRTTASDPWGDPENLGAVVNSAYHEILPELSPDGLLLMFVDYPDGLRPGGYGGTDLWMARRATISSSWQTPVNLGPTVNSNSHDWQPLISPDGFSLYFIQTSGNTGTAWMAPILPIVDFNGDGIVDIDDLVILIESWGQANPQCDIGPFAWGDGTVDAADLEILMSHWGEEVNDPTLLAHWALDEETGMTAADTVGGNNTTVMGNATWQPSDGKIDGALSFDGKDDFAMSAKPVLDPAKGPFSVLVWIKGGSPGQTILSQGSGANWLMTDATGALATELSKGGRVASKLSSQAVITDGNWHRIAFVWDGTSRRIYVDSVLAAEDTQGSLAASSGSLFIGTSKSMSPGTFWSGLIDDVRIYNRVVTP